MNLLRRLTTPRTRPEPVLDVGLQAERTAMAWQRTALGVGGFGALLLHMAQRNVIAMVPGLLGLLAALAMLVLAEHRYVTSMRKIDLGKSPIAAPMLHLLVTAVVVLGLAAIVLLVTIAT